MTQHTCEKCVGAGEVCGTCGRPRDRHGRWSSCRRWRKPVPCPGSKGEPHFASWTECDVCRVVKQGSFYSQVLCSSALEFTPPLRYTRSMTKGTDIVVTFRGRKLGAIGLSQDYALHLRDIPGVNLDAPAEVSGCVLVKVYSEFEHISGLRWTTLKETQQAVCNWVVVTR